MTEEESPVCEEDERKKAEDALNDCLTVLREAKLRTQDLVVVYGNLGYSLGANIDKIKEGEGPTMAELQEKYYTEPTLGTALMLQGILVTSWHDQVSKGMTVETLKENDDVK